MRWEFQGARTLRFVAVGVFSRRTDMQLREGQRLAPDLVLRARIAGGGQGEVWRADDERLGVAVAVKVLREGASSRYLRGRFEQEARVLGMLDHPHLTRLLRFDLESPRPWIALELAEGEPLHQIVHDRDQAAHPIEARWARAVIAQVCSALAYAHARGVVHRDIKLSNVIVGPRARLVDFGVAKLLTQSATQVTTAMRGPVGTLSYFAPEQIDSGPITERTDIHALGTTVFAMLTGRSPWHDPNDPPTEVRSRIIERISSGERPRITRYRPDLAPILDVVLARAMAIDPAARHDSVDALAADLDAALSVGDDTIADEEPATIADLRSVVRGETPQVPVLQVPQIVSIPIEPNEGTESRGQGMPFAQPWPRALLSGRMAWPLAVTVWGLVALVYVIARGPERVSIPASVGGEPSAEVVAPEVRPARDTPAIAPPPAASASAAPEPPATTAAPQPSAATAAPRPTTTPARPHATPAPSPPAPRDPPPTDRTAHAPASPTPEAIAPLPSNAPSSPTRAAVARYRVDATEAHRAAVLDALTHAAASLALDDRARLETCLRAFRNVGTPERADACLALYEALKAAR